MSRRALLGATVAFAIVASVGVTVSPAIGQMGPMGPGGPGTMYGPGYGQGRMGPGMMGSGPGMMGGCPMMGMTSEGQALMFTEGRIAFLKTELGITDAQKAVWDSYADAIKRNLQNMQSMWQSMKAVFEAKTPVERLDAHIGTMDGRLGALKAIRPALADLYAALTADQKKKADEILTGVGCMM